MDCVVFELSHFMFLLPTFRRLILFPYSSENLLLISIKWRWKKAMRAELGEMKGVIISWGQNSIFRIYGIFIFARNLTQLSEIQNLSASNTVGKIGSKYSYIKKRKKRSVDWLKKLYHLNLHVLKINLYFALFAVRHQSKVI